MGKQNDGNGDKSKPERKSPAKGSKSIEERKGRLKPKRPKGKDGN